MTASNLVPIPELFVSQEIAAKLKVEAGNLPSWDLTPRQVCDLDLLMNGGFRPLKGFLSKADYDSVLSDMRLGDGSLRNHVLKSLSGRDYFSTLLRVRGERHRTRWSFQ